MLSGRAGHWQLRLSVITTSIFREHWQAFFYPTRLAVALVISILAVITVCILSVDAIIYVRDTISKADARAIRTIFTGVASVQSLFSSTALP